MIQNYVINNNRTLSYNRFVYLNVKNHNDMFLYSLGLNIVCLEFRYQKQYIHKHGYRRGFTYCDIFYDSRGIHIVCNLNFFFRTDQNHNLFSIRLNTEKELKYLYYRSIRYIAITYSKRAKNIRHPVSLQTKKKNI